VSGLVGASRIYPQVRPPDERLTAVVLTLVGDRPGSQPLDDGGEPDTLLEYRLQVDCYSSQYLEAQALGRAVRRVLTRLGEPELSANHESGRDLYDDETKEHRSTADYIVFSS
jgi:hypothetical protein